MAKAKLTLDGYTRVSKIGGRGGEGFIAADVQRDQIEAYARELGGDVVEWHEDLDFSGANTDRPGFQAALDRVEHGETGGLIVAKLDRFSRDAADGGKIVKRIIGAGGVFASAAERIDPKTPFGKYALTTMLAMGELQLDNIRSGWKAATASAIKRGVHPHAPFGYMRGEDRRLVPDPETAPLVAEVFDRARGESWAGIARFLDGRAPKGAGRRWTRRAVQNMIGNRCYLGEAFYGTERNPSAHPRLVGLDVFDAAHHARGVRPARGKNPALLSGLVRCAGCRYRMRAARVGNARMRVYRCDRTHGTGNCPAPASVTADTLDVYVEQAFLVQYGTTALVGQDAEGDVADTRERLADAEAEVAAYLNSEQVRRVRDDLPEHYEAGLASRMDAVQESRRELVAARHRVVGIDLSENLLDTWPDLGVEERRQLLAAGIDTVFIRRAGRVGRPPPLDEHRAKVLWRGEAPDDLPGPGRRVEAQSFDW